MERKHLRQKETGIFGKVQSLFSLLLLPAITVSLLSSCASDSGQGGSNSGKEIVINELMASNRTGLLSAKGKTHDWIELKNITSSPISLEGYSLVSTYSKSTKKKKKKQANTIDDSDTPARNEDDAGSSTDNQETDEWIFPDTTIEAGGRLVIFATKKGPANPDRELYADIKIPKEGGSLSVLSPSKSVVSELTYTDMGIDQSLRRLPDGTYEKTYWQTPGFENTPEGYEQYNTVIDRQRKSPLLIWEVMSRMDKNTFNWIELKNVSDSAVDLSTYCLASKKGKEWQLPAKTLAPGQIVTIQAAGRNAKPNAPLQASFSLGNAETVVLTKDGKFVDGICAKPAGCGVSVGRRSGHKGFFFFASPSRGADNYDNAYRLIAPQPKLSKASGIYHKTKKLVLRLDSTAGKVHYTLDGTEPTTSSPLWKDSLVITESTVVRAYTEGDSATMRSNTLTSTYLLNEQHTLPVVCIAMNEADLYDYSHGIYAQGPGYNSEWPHMGANYWKNWTKDAHVEFFDGKDGFSLDCGIKIFGGFSRVEAKKSFCLKFKKKYGEGELTYDFFGQGKPVTLEDLVLRSGSQDYNRCMVRDEFFTSLMAAQSPTLLTQPYRPVALYINAKYFGLFYLRDKIDRDFVARRLNVSNDSITIIMSKGYQEEGNNIEYNKLISYITSHDMTDKANYDYVKDRIDLQGLIDFKLGEIYSANTDVGNIRYVRSTDTGCDKKWYFVFYDLDATWVGNKPTASYYLSVAGEASEGNVSVHNRMINGLLANSEFRQLFLRRLSHHLHHTFTTKNTTKVFDGIVNVIRPEMKRNCERWPQLSYSTWEKNIVQFRKKFADRNKVMLNDLRQLLSITEKENKKYFGDLGY